MGGVNKVSARSAERREGRALINVSHSSSPSPLRDRSQCVCPVMNADIKVPSLTSLPGGAQSSNPTGCHSHRVGRTSRLKVTPIFPSEADRAPLRWQPVYEGICLVFH